MFERSEYRMGRRLVWLAGAAALWAGAAWAETPYPVTLKAEGLEPALIALAGQTHQQIMFSKALVAGRAAPAVIGQMTPEAALAQLLTGTGLVARRVSPQMIVVEGAKPAVPNTSEGADGRPFAGDAGRAGDADTAVTRAPGEDPAPGRAVTTLTELRVTGSNLRGAPPAAPVRLLSAEALERTGQVTFAEALRSLPENFGGGAGEGNALTGADTVGRNTAYGSALNLRGLGNGATLVLLNGRRLAGSGTFGDFVDISALPSIAVERAEVLLDGASAVYGSDAVGGVVNVLMRPDFDGAESQVTAGVGTAGEPAQARLAQLFGRRWAGGGFVVAYELARRDALHAADRAYSRSADLRPFGGDDFRQTNAFPGNILKTDPLTGGQVPGYAIPLGQSGTTLKPSDFVAGSVNLQNPRVGSDVLPRQTTNSLYVAAHQEVGPVTLLADARYSTRRFSARLEPVISTLSVSRANPFYVSPVGAASEAIAYSWASDLGNPVSQGTVETFGASLSGKAGLFGDWQGQAYGAFDQEIDEVRGAGFINSLILSEALGNVADRPDTPYSPGRDGYFNPFAGTAGSNPTGVLAAIGSGRTWTRSRSRVGVVNVQADGSLLQLPAGALKLALGASARRETYVRTGSNWLSTPAPVPISNPTNAGRTVLAAFAEARVPLVAPDNALPGVERLELSMAGRIEHYALAGTSANPSVGVLWQPTHNLVVRGTFSHSFRAPALREMFDPATVSPTLLARGGVRVRTLTLNGGNPGLDPETARSWTGGLDWTPARWPGLKLSLTAYDVRFSNRIGRPASANLSNALTDPSLAPFVRLISPGTNPADLAAINAALASAPFTSVSGSFPATDYGAIVDLRYVNTTTLHVRGIDASATYAFEAGPRDHVVLSGSGSYMLDYQQQFTPRSAVVDDVNVANFPLRFRGRFTADWTRGRLTLGGAANYTGRYRDSRGERIGDFLDVDLQARLAPAHSGPLKGVAVLLNVRNLFDRDPPFYNNPDGLAYDPANADPIGRFVSLQLTRAW